MTDRGKRLFFLLSVMLAALSLTALPAKADSAPAARSIESEGSAKIAQSENAARQEAIEDALWQAVRSVLGRVPASREPKDFVKSYRIIDGGAESGRYVVKLLVTVTADLSANDEKSKLRWSGNPRLMVVIPETSFGLPRPDPAGETEMIRQLTEAHLHVLDSSEVAVIRETTDMRQLIKQADVAAMKRLGAKYDCDIIVAGEAFSDVVPGSVGDFVSAEAQIEARAFIVDSGTMLASDSVSAGGSALTLTVAGKTALRNAAAKLAAYLVPRIKEAITEQPRLVTVKVTNVGTAALLDHVQDGIRHLAGVESVQRRSFDQAARFASLDVETYLLTDQLSKALTAVKGLTVQSSTGQELALRVETAKVMEIPRRPGAKATQR